MILEMILKWFGASYCIFFVKALKNLNIKISDTFSNLFYIYDLTYNLWMLLS